MVTPLCVPVRALRTQSVGKKNALKEGEGTERGMTLAHQFNESPGVVNNECMVSSVEPRSGAMTGPGCRPDGRPGEGLI